jgi:hypothetical protein
MLSHRKSCQQCYTVTVNTANFAITISSNSNCRCKNKVYGQVDPALTFVSSPAGGSLQMVKTSALQVHCRDYGETVVGGPAIGQNTVANSNYTITYVGGEPCHSGNQYLTYRYAASVRYMDNLTMTAVVKPVNTVTPLTGSIEFKIGAVMYEFSTGSQFQ